jgi:hypothetical protein
LQLPGQYVCKNENKGGNELIKVNQHVKVRFSETNTIDKPAGRLIREKV